MRKRKNLIPRLEAVSARFAGTPGELKQRAGGRPLWAELGCGMGKYISLSASERPDVFFVGFERVREAVVVAAERAELDNLAFVCRDVDELDIWLEPNSVDRMFIHFCDPWHKKRHAKRRLTYRNYLRKYAALLSKNGILVVKTDNTALFDFTLEELNTEGWELLSVSRDWHNDPYRDSGEHMTEYETKFSERGQAICRLSAKPNR